jgi:Domain of unknown function (DUF4189)
MGAVMRFLGRLALLIGALTVFGAASPASASCYSDCMIGCTGYGQSSSYSCTTKSGYCSGKCLMEGGGVAKTFGAIAYSESTGSYGYSYKFANRKQAETEARNQCANKGGRNCKVATWYVDSCGALAKSSHGPWGVGQKNSQQAAQKEAQAYCKQHGGRDCSVVFTGCSRDGS